MEKLALCRMCLAKNVPMRLVAQKNLQEMFKLLTAAPFVTDDRRPAVACVTCCARLHNCYKFMNNCLQSEELLQQVLNSDALDLVTLEQLPSTRKFGRSAVVHTNCEGVLSDNTEVHVRGQTPVFFEVEVKKEIIEEENTESNEEQHVEYDVSQWANTEVDPLNEYKHNMIFKTEDIEFQTCDDMMDEDRTPRVNRSKMHEDNTSHVKNESTVGNAAKRSRHKTSHKRLNEVCASPGYKKHECGFCKKHFNSKYSLKTHLRIHTGDKPYKCNICSKGFSQNSNLITHKRIHTGEKPHKCNLCSKTFTEKQALVKHTRTHTGDKPYKCIVCSKSFTQKGDFAIHSRIHTGDKPYKCHICNMCFPIKRHLDSHNRIHSGEKPYKCNDCSKCFIRQRDLDRHICTHTGDKPFKCNICGKGFIEKNKLVKHNRMHTGNPNPN